MISEGDEVNELACQSESVIWFNTGNEDEFFILVETMGSCETYES